MSIKCTYPKCYVLLHGFLLFTRTLKTLMFTTKSITGITNYSFSAAEYYIYFQSSSCQLWQNYNEFTAKVMNKVSVGVKEPK